MKNFGLVRVRTGGGQWSKGELAIVSGNEKSIAVRLGDKPDGLDISGGVFLDGGGIVLLLSKKADGIGWLDMVSGKTFEVEDL